ncbi:hypothetical protein KEM55_003824 [Ascosphaera atra]|nr:hypothetical protein KEM55_003824 [Ascosphaera atra]
MSARIQDILNDPVSPAPMVPNNLKRPSTSTTMPARSMSGPGPSKRQRTSSSPATNTPKQSKGVVRYQPFEENHPELVKAYKEFDIKPHNIDDAPMGSIARYPKSVPYQSSKKGFLEKTGRKQFEVYAYSFKLPGKPDPLVMMWDYNIGLVRTTALFKAYKERKSTPKRAIELNPGLQELCHNVTGGQIDKQGYWMPFDAAKAIAATFCYSIRWALVPVFGLDFPAICIPPNTKGHKLYQIDPSIIRKAEAQAQAFRDMEIEMNEAISNQFHSTLSGHHSRNQQQLPSPRVYRDFELCKSGARADSACDDEACSLSSVRDLSSYNAGFYPPTPQTLNSSPSHTFINPFKNQHAQQRVDSFSNMSLFSAPTATNTTAASSPRQSNASLLPSGGASSCGSSTRAPSSQVSPDLRMGAESQMPTIKRTVDDEMAALVLLELAGQPLVQ